MKKIFIYPDSRFKVIWDLIILFTTIGVTIQAPLVIIFNIPSQGFFLLFDIIITLIFTVDIYINFNTGYLQKREMINDHSKIAKRYLGFWFWPDMLATIPFYAFAGTNFLVLNRLFRFFRLSRLLKLFTGAKTIRKAKELNINPSIMRLVLLVFWILIAAHLITCIWIFIDGIPPMEDNALRYLQGLYWTVTTLTTIGYGDISPDLNNPIQMMFTILIELIGAGIYGFIIGNIANLIANIDVAKTQYREKVEKINTFLKYRNIPNNLQKRINDYYDYLWESRRGYDENSVLKDLPGSLKTQVSLFLNKEIIEKVPLFKGASSAFIKEIIMNMQPVVYTPGDYVVIKGEIGYEMYFISRGSVDVVSEDESIVYATLTSGQFFGEIALLLSTPRNATIKAKDYCDLYSLDKDTFERILLRYPKFAKNIEDLAEKRRKETEASHKRMQEEDAKTTEEAESVELDKLPHIATGLKYLWESDGTLTLSWNATEKTLHYTILRKVDESGEKWETIGSAVKQTQFSDPVPWKDSLTLYRVRGENKEGCGPWSDVLSVRPPIED